MYRGWKICLLEFGDNHRKVMTEGKYTELFFLDEAVAFAAGHRPCFDCQPERFYEFRKCWDKTNSRRYGLIDPLMDDIDIVLEKERIAKGGVKVTYKDYAINVARGAFVEYGGKPYLKLGNLFYEWAPSGYVAAIKLPHNQEVRVLTPKSIVRCFKNDFTPKIHESIQKLFQI
jgi:hypothetical protein